MPVIYRDAKDGKTKVVILTEDITPEYIDAHRTAVQQDIDEAQAEIDKAQEKLKELDSIERQYNQLNGMPAQPEQPKPAEQPAAAAPPAPAESEQTNEQKQPEVQGAGNPSGFPVQDSVQASASVNPVPSDNPAHVQLPPAVNDVTPPQGVVSQDQPAAGSIIPG